MKKLTDKSIVRVTRELRVEFTRAEVTQALSSRAQAAGHLLPNQMTLLRADLAVGDDGEFFVDFCFSSEQPSAPDGVPMYWNCRVDFKGRKSINQWVLSPKRDWLGLRIGQAFPEVIGWAVIGEPQHDEPYGIPATQILEVVLDSNLPRSDCKLQFYHLSVERDGEHHCFEWQQGLNAANAVELARLRHRQGVVNIVTQFGRPTPASDSAVAYDINGNQTRGEVS